MRRCSVITAGHLHHDHIAAVEGLQGPVTIDRRCADLAELVAAARAGWADAALIIGDTYALTGTLLAELAECGLIVVAVSDVAGERTRLASLGIVALPDEVTAEILVDALRGRSVPAASAGEPFLEGAAQDWTGSSPGPAPDPGTGSEAAGADRLDEELEDLLRSTEAEETPHAPDDRVQGPGLDAADRMDEEQDAPEQEDAAEDASDQATACDLTEEGSSAAADGGAESSGAAPVEGRLAGITTVWGAPGSPGRSTLAVNLAAELALTGTGVLLIDADTIAASVATHLGLLEESAGLAQVCRKADLGRLDSARLRRTATVVDISGSRLHLLTGLPRADRWPELREGALRQVLQLAAREFDHVVVDVAAPTEQDEELTFDTRAPQRHAATIAAVEEAHTLLAVGAPDPVSFPRLIKSLDDLRLNVPAARAPRVLINQIRREAVGHAPEDQLREAWLRFGPEEPLEAFLPWDRAACDDALLTGRVLAEAAPESTLRRAVAELAGADLPRRRRRLLRR